MVNIAKIAVGVLLAVALALGVYGWMLAKSPKVSDPQVQGVTVDGKPGSTVNVVVAKQTITAGQVLKAEDLQLAGFPSKPEGAYDDISTAVGSVPAVDIPKDAPVLKGQLVTGLALKVPEGERAVAVKVDESVGAGNRIRPGTLSMCSLCCAVMAMKSIRARPVCCFLASACWPTVRLRWMR